LDAHDEVVPVNAVHKLVCPVVVAFVEVALSIKIYNGPKLMLFEKLTHKIGFSNISLHKIVPSIIFN